VQPTRGEREALALEAVRLAVDLGVDVNAADHDGRTALDSARALKYESVVEYLVGKGARVGTEKDRESAVTATGGVRR
jgi:ankyrin repeat protein